MRASIASPEAQASSARRRPSTKIESVAFPSRTARARRSRELSRLLILVIADLRLTGLLTGSLGVIHPWVLVPCSCDFLDRTQPHDKRIHEITRIDTVLNPQSSIGNRQ